MKQLNIFKKVTPLLSVMAMTPAMATDLSVPLNFTTLPVISIVPVTAMDFGAVLSLTQADECTLEVTSGAIAITPSEEGADLTSAVYGTTVAAVNVGALSDDCTGAPDGQVGIYNIISFVDADITVSVTPGVATDISFIPDGYVINSIEAGLPSRETLQIGLDANVNATAGLTAYGAAGTNRAIIGGTITNLVPLVAGMPYATDFNLNVVYQ